MYQYQLVRLDESLAILSLALSSFLILSSSFSGVSELHRPTNLELISRSPLPLASSCASILGEVGLNGLPKALSPYLLDPGADA
jgi:hypothetical protein